MGGNDSPGGAKVSGNGPAVVVAYPAHYWEASGLSLVHKKNKVDSSLDERGAKEFKQTATAPREYVTELQNDLASLGYLVGADRGKDREMPGYYGAKTQRAVTRFQRHAKRIYRVVKSTKDADDVSADGVFAGSVDGVCDEATALEIRRWVDKGWGIPVGRFKLKDLSEKVADGDGKPTKKFAQLRSDAADEWGTIMQLVSDQGGTLAGPYSGTPRPLSALGGKKTGKGASAYSFHFCGRAVDINQDHTKSKGVDGKGRRYWVSKDESGSTLFWRIYCKTEKREGSHVLEIEKGTKKFWSFGEKKEVNIPAGWYVDLTAAIESTRKFQRIKAHKDWQTNYNGAEWWHFQYFVDTEDTFLDECELIGYTEAELRAAGWKTDAMLDHPPG